MIIKTDPAIIAGYLEDASGFIQGAASRLVIPENEDEVADFLREASAGNEPVTIAGGRTGVAAGCIPRRGSLLSLERLDWLGPITKTNSGNTISVGPSVRLETLKEAVKRAGLMYPPDPTEPTATLGGNVATNASGGQCFKYGSTRHSVLGLTLVLSTGERLTLERGKSSSQEDMLSYYLNSGRRLDCPRPQLGQVRVEKNAAGYFSAPGMDPLDLLIGMDGTLGVITSLTLRLLPAVPGIFSLAIFFSDPQAAVACAEVIRASSRGIKLRRGISPASLEFMDERSLALLRPDFPSLPETARSVLLIEQEYPAKREDAALTDWSDFLEAEDVPENMIWFAETEQDRARLRELRHALPERVNTLVRQRKLPKVGTDMAVPEDVFPGMLGVYYQGLEASGLDFLVFGHIGECHLHANVLPHNQVEYNAAKSLYLRFAQEAVARGGTVSAEHGIGKIKHDFLKLMVGEKGFREMARVKRCFDPALILNRDNVFPESYLRREPSPPPPGLTSNRPSSRINRGDIRR